MYTKDNNRGMALMLTLFFIAISIVVLSTLSARLLNQSHHVDHFRVFKDCFNGLEAALEESKLEIEAGKDGWIGLDSWQAPAGQLVLPEFDQTGVVPESFASIPEIEYFALAQDWSTDGIDNTGDGDIDGSDERFTYTIHAFARNGQVTRHSETVVRGIDVNVWRNAIFAGSGQAGGVIKGNVSIHGSVHVLGDNILAGGASLAAIDLSGTSLIHNNYDGIPADLLARIPALTKSNWNDEMVESLDASLRVKKGLVGMSGNSEIGSPDTPGNAFKETMDGTYVSDGWTGNAVVDDGDRGDPLSVSSDNGWDELYDLGDRVSFPLLTDEWHDPDTGAMEWNNDTGDWYTHADYFNQVLVADPLVKDDGAYNGNIILYTRGDDFYWNATTNEELNGSLPATPPAPDDDYILFDASTDTLLINGQLAINGDLTLRGQGNETSIHYSGRAALLVKGNVQLDTDLLSCNNGNPADTANSFPVNNIIGIMGAQDMVVGSVAQISLMGAFYAQNRIQSSKQTNVIGTFVSKYFDMGSNVPSIFQVPSLADNLPLGMIGNYPIMSLTQLSWREIGVTL